MCSPTWSATDRQCFEGIRCYETKQGPAAFRLREHMRRLLNSGHIYRMEMPYSLEELCGAAAEVVRENHLIPATSGPSCCAAMAILA